MPKENTYPKFISTKPLGEDHFAGGAQQRMAGVVSEQIQKQTFRLIGIDGPWGSGKSNVIELLKEQLKTTHHFFIYDTWSHQEDLQRRSFLEELTDDLVRALLIDKKKWENKLNVLLSKTKITTTREIPTLSIALILTLAIALLIPVSKAVIDALPTTDDWTERKVWISITPFIFGMVVYFVAAIKTGKWQVNELFAMYKNKETERVLDETISEREPTVTKFRRWMEDLAIAVKDRKLVIVFDNMDRLPKNRVQALWSNIHTFFAEVKYKDLVVLVPFDRIHIGNAFAGEDGPDKSSTAGTGEYFINKTFPVVFTVPPAPFTDWRKFFVKKYREAFGGNDPEAEACATIYDVYNLERTPREIIAFINNVVGLKLTWKNEFATKYLALFAATRKDHFKDNARAAILEGNYAIPANSLFRGDEELPGIMAALYYNLAKDKAAEVILYREVELALRDKDAERLGKLSGHADFSMILEDVLNKNAVQLEPFVTTLDAMDKLKSSPAESTTPAFIWNCAIGKKIGTKEPYAKEVSLADHILLKKAKELGRLTALARCICAGLAEQTNFNGGVYGKQVMALELFIKEEQLDLPMNNILPRLDMYGDHYLFYVAETKDDFDKYMVATNALDLEGRIVERLGDLSKTYLGRYLSTFPMPNLDRQIAAIIENDLTIQNFDDIYKIHAYRKGNSKMSIPSETSLRALLSNFENDPRFERIVAMRYSAGSKISLNGRDIQLFDRQDQPFIGKVAENILDFINVQDLFKLMLELNKHGLIEVVRLIITERRYEDATVNLKEILPKFFEILTRTGTTAEEFMVYLDQWNVLVDQQINPNELKSVIAGVEFLETISSIDVPLSGEILNLGSKYLDEIRDKAEWTDRLTNGDGFELLLLSILMRNERFPFELPESLLAAFPDILTQLMESDSVALFSPASSERLNLLFGNATVDQIGKEVKAFRDTLIMNYDISPAKFLFFEPFLRRFGNLGEHAVSVINNVLTKVADNQLALERFMSFTDFYLQLIQQAGSLGLPFIQSLRDFVETHDESTLRLEVSQFIVKSGQFVFPGIHIHHAIYRSTGDHEKFRDVSVRIREMLKSGTLFHFKLHNSIAGTEDNDPEYGVTKNLEIDYERDRKRIQVAYREENWVRFPE